ncbi:GMP synthase-Glutamine amidotransferase [Thermostaphylospora chromogena]|uniref:GMP synthase-Glutamine amidotransferase n=2 Tax=Thermostaphylospora chromogena TaxID=35622 RepID=A0A1H1G1W1_9ACTN|nr:GMP synthase-Glutamine amidotransferase [Thermostaphylospora chromogena]
MWLWGYPARGCYEEIIDDMGVLVVEHEASAGPGYLAEWLAAAGTACRVVRPYTGDRLPARADDGLIVLGGTPSAWDDQVYPWLPATRELLRRSVADGVPTLGVCLGAQLLTLACGGTVERGTAGLEVGVHHVRPLPAAADDPLFRHLRGPAPAVQYHRDAMVRLPDGAVPLATGDRYPNQAYRLGETAWAVQFHPEAGAEIFASWAAASSDKLTARGYDVEELTGQAKQAETELVAAWRPLAEAFAKIVDRTRKTA